MKKIIILLICISVLCTAFASCKKNGKTGQTTAETEVTETTDNTKYKANVPANQYNNSDYTIMCRSKDGAWGEWAIKDEGQSSVTIEEATYRRNMSIEEQFKIDFKYYEITDTSKTTNGIFYQALQANELSGDYICDLCIPGCTDAATLATTGVFYDLNTVKYIDLTAPWWQQKLNDSVAVLGHYYFAVNDMLLNDKLDTYAIYFNKDVFTDNDLQYPYGLVYDGTWTMEKFYGYFKGFGSDLDNDNEKDLEDRYGLVTYINDVFFVGSGITGASLNSDGIPEITEFNEKISQVYDYILEIQGTNDFDVWNRKVQKASYNDYQAVFDIKSMFMNTALSSLQTVSESYVSSIGIVPVPKYDDMQPDYISRAGYGGATGVSILLSSRDIEYSAIICEAMAAESKNIISPAFYDVLLGTRYADSEDDTRMISIIIDSEIFDLDQIYKWGNIIISYADSANKADGEAASSYAKIYSSAVEKLNSYIETLED